MGGTPRNIGHPRGQAVHGNPNHWNQAASTAGWDAANRSLSSAVNRLLVANYNADPLQLVDTK